VTIFCLQNITERRPTIIFFAYGQLAGTQIERRKCPAEIPRCSGACADYMRDYKSLRGAVMICNTLVNTQTHKWTAFDRLYY